MKKKILFIVVLTFLLSLNLCTAFGQGRWTYFGGDNQQTCFLDNSSIKFEKIYYADEVTVWIKINLIQERQYVLQHIKIDFNQKTYTIMVSDRYDTNGNLLSTISYPVNNEHIPPDSYIEYLSSLLYMMNH